MTIGSLTIKLGSNQLDCVVDEYQFNCGAGSYSGEQQSHQVAISIFVGWFTPPLLWDEGTAQTAVQIRLEEK